MRKKNGFTLIELLVVISIIAMLLAILMPSLGMVKKKAQAVVCKSNLKQWGLVFLLYTQDNHDKFWEDHYAGGTQGKWMPMLSETYGDVDKFRFCPSAKKMNGSQGGIGTTFNQWGPGPLMAAHNFGPDEKKNSGSYGTNLWINDVSNTGGWRGLPEYQWEKTNVARASEIPMITDQVWFGTNPMGPDDPKYNGTGEVPPTEDFYAQMNPLSPQWGWDMARVCINRHDKGVNMTFIDGSTRKVKLTNLWNLKWHRGSVKIKEMEIPWL